MKILLIMPKFFNDPETIQMGLRNLGHDVKWVDDRPSNDPFTKALVRVNKEVLSRPIDRYFESVRHDAEEAQYDLVLVVSGQSLSFCKEHLLRLRCVIPNARFVLYQWDAVENYPHVLSVLDCFDEAYTFDERDSRLYRMEFLPLFYHPGYQAIGRRSKAKIEADYDVAFIGTAHPKKYGFVQEVVDADTPQKEIDALGRIDTKTAAVINTREFDIRPLIGGEGEIRLEEYRPNYLRYEYTATAPGTAIFSEIYYKDGWTAYIDGIETPYFRADYLLRGMELPAGTHTVEWRFRAPGWNVAEGVTLASSLAILAGIIATVILVLRHERRQKTQA